MQRRLRASVGGAFVLFLIAGCGGSETPLPVDLGPGVDLPPGTDGPGGDAQKTDQGPVQSDLGPCGNCDDGLPCTEDTCAGGHCAHEPKAGTCLIDGACHAQGDKADPAGCGVCLPQVSQTDWSDDVTACADDGISCTTASCSSGACSYPVDAGFCLVDDQCVKDGDDDPNNPCQLCDTSTSTNTYQPRPDGAACPADSLSCTEDVCAQGSCTHPLKEDACLIGGVCYLNGEVNPFVDCHVCDPTKSQSGWSPQPDGAACADDGLTCTYDVCSQGSCGHPAKPGTCLIAGNCYGDGDTNPVGECQQCAPGQSPTSWSPKPNGTPCTTDPHSCTDDVCVTGSCGHPLQPGHCLIAGACYADDDPVGTGGCTICASAVNTQSGTFAAGMSCDDGASATTMDTCIGAGCHGFATDGWEWLSSDTETVMTGVAHVPGSGATWAVGSYFDGTDHDGFIARLNGPSGVPSSLVWAEQHFHSIHDRMAVGLAGQCLYFNGSGWNTASDVASHMGAGVDVQGVWGVSLSGVDRTFYLAASGSRLARCFTPDNGASFACSDHSGASGSMIRVVGTVTTQPAQGPLWAVRGDSYEDIFFNPGTGTTWTTGSPEGCFDATGAPCGDTAGRFLDLWASSPDEVWAVGEAGLVMRYDGSAWSKVTIPTLTSPSQSSYVFRGVYADGDLVLLVGDRDYNGLYHDLIAVFYNRKLDRWFWPQLLQYTSATDPNKDSLRLHDVGGQDFSSVYLVGSQWDSGEQRALYMTVQ